jgi:hypothetical protein
MFNTGCTTGINGCCQPGLKALFPPVIEHLFMFIVQKIQIFLNFFAIFSEFFIEPGASTPGFRNALSKNVVVLTSPDVELTLRGFFFQVYYIVMHVTS